MIKRTFVLVLILFFGAAISAQSGETKKSVDEYIGDLKSSDDAVVITAARQLGLVKAKPAIDPLVEVLKTNKNPQVRISAASSLGQIGEKGAPTNALSSAVQTDEDNAVVYASLLAILNLADFDNPSAEEALDYAEKNKSDDEFIKDVVSRIRKAMKK